MVSIDDNTHNINYYVACYVVLLFVILIMDIQYIDLFCGAGGLGEGFTQAEFSSALHVDSDEWAIDTVRMREIYHQLKAKGKLESYYNTIKGSNGPLSSVLFNENKTINMRRINSKAIRLNINEGSVIDLITTIHNSRDENTPLVIIGGPPCQAYSLAKRSRMRKPIEGLHGEELNKALDENNERVDKYLSDERHDLYSHYLKIIHETQPDAFVYENVPGILTAQTKLGKNSKTNIIDLFNNDLNLKAGGYDLISMEKPERALLFPSETNRAFKEFLVDASNYDIPQKRKRFILIGIRSSLKNNNKALNFQKIFESTVSQFRSNEKITVKDAIWDLPRVKCGKGNNYFWNKKYEKSGSVYSDQLACQSMGGILNHFARNHMKEDLERYRYFAEYALKNYKNATLFDLTRERNDLLPNHRSATNLIDGKGKKNRNAKYVDRFKVQLKNEPATTITAHIAKDGHAFIHPLPGQNRSLTVREAARLQSFPDDYAFCGPRTEQFKQVGNAVPVLLAKIIATGIKKVLESCNGR